MITNFRLFGMEHIISLLLPAFACAIFIICGLRAKAEVQHRNIRLVLAGTIVLVRSVRYVMDVCFGVFEWTDLLSLHICHIDLILLVVCLIKPRKAVFDFCFLVGIPMALSVALFPGTNHPAPGMPRAMLFIMSHMMLVTGAIYLAVILNLKPGFKGYIVFAISGNLSLVILYFLNSILHTNYLYIMKAPPGTAIEALEKIFGWPEYVLVMDVLAMFLMLLMFIIGQFLPYPGTKKRKGPNAFLNE